MTSALFKRYKTDSNLEEDGVWEFFGDGVRVKIRRFSSQFSRNTRKKLEKPHADAIRRNSVPESVLEDILDKQIAWGVIADWEGVSDDEGNPLAATDQNKLAIIKALPEFRDEVFAFAIGRDNFKQFTDEDTEKNSSTS